MQVLKRLLVLVVAGLAVSLPVVVSAQAVSGASIAGVVRDSSGAVLPGVTVEASSPALIEKVRSVVTDTAGQYKIEDLRPGTYSVTFTLPGFAALKREGIELSGAFVAPVNAELTVGNVQETVTVSGETPVVDVQSAVRQRVFSDELLQAIPAGRSHINEVVLIPGVQASQPGRGGLADVGGTNNLQNTTFSIHGGRTSDTRLQLDGVRLGNVLTAGEFSNFVPDQGATQEVAVDYGAISAELAFGGLRINLVPKEGGNTFKGSLFATGVNDKWQANNLTADLQSRGLPAPNRMKVAYDVNPSGGGPIVRDKLWFFVSGRTQTNQNYIAGQYANANAGDPTKWNYVADPTNQEAFRITQKGIDTRLTWQASEKNKLSIYGDNQSRVWDDSRAGVSPESVVAYRFPVLRLVQGGWTSTLSSRLLLEVRYANRGESFGNLPDLSGPWNDLIPVLEQSSNLEYRGRGGDGGASGLMGYSAQSINTAVASMSFVTGSHSFKGGFSDTWADTKSSTISNSTNLYYRFNNGVPNQITEYGTPTVGESQVKGEYGAYIQDRWTHNRSTINVGIRYDQFVGGYPVQYLGPAPLQPTRNLTFPAVTGTDFRDFTPRLGESFDLFGNGKTALKVSLGKYMLGVMNVGNPAGIVTTVTRAWTDANGNFSPDCDTLNLQAQDLRSSGGDYCGIVSNTAFGQPTSATQYNSDTRFGWNNRPYNWEFSTSVQHQLMPRVGLEVGYFRRWFGNSALINPGVAAVAANQNLLTTVADYDVFNITAPSDPRLPGGGGYSIGGLYNVSPGKSGQVTNYTTLARDFGTQTEHWNGVDVSMNARLEHNITIQGGFSTGRTTIDMCPVTSKLPELLFVAASGTEIPASYCHIQTNLMGQTQVKMLGNYLIPKIGVSVAGTFQSVPGPQISANYTVTTAVAQQTLGRPLSGGAANVLVNLIAPGTLYGERANQLDTRISRPFRAGWFRTQINLDVYNTLNASPVIQENSSYAVWRTPQRIMDGRLFKVSAQIDF